MGAILEDEPMQDDSDEDEGDSVPELGQMAFKEETKMNAQMNQMNLQQSSMPSVPGLLGSSGGMPQVPGLLGQGSVQKPSLAPASKASGQSGLSQLRSQYDPLPWSDFYDTREMIENRVPVYTAGNQGHVFVCLHGCGHSAMSFACLAKELKGRGSTVVSFDWRGHGDHHCENEQDLSQETLVADTLQVLNFVNQKFPESTIVLVGHSMGGAIATKTCDKIMKEMEGHVLEKQVQGLFVIDVVEGTALEALPVMDSIVAARPTRFADLQSVVKYGITSGQVRDKTSARLSMPSQVVEVEDPLTKLKKYVWRTDLIATKQYWEGWFRGLTECFLNVRCKKQLLLAAADRMDMELTKAHMMGKYKMVVIDNCGHVIQEDQPAKVAESFVDFMTTFRIPTKFQQKIYITSVSGKQVLIGV